MKTWTLITLALVAAGCGAADEPDLASGTVEVAAPDDDDKADAATELRQRLAGTTVWTERALRVEERDGQRVWVLGGRTSRTLRSAFSFVPDDPFCEARVVSARRFEILVRPDHELNSLLSGLPLFVRLEVAGADPITAALWIAPRFARFQGTSQLRIARDVAPVWFGGRAIYRGRVEAPASVGAIAIHSGDGADPAVAREGAGHFRFDWDYEGLARVADPPGDPVYFDAARLRKRASVDLAVAKLGLTTEDPYEVWAGGCADPVRACLGALRVGALDTEACGSYRAVALCGGARTAAEPARDAVVAALREHLVGHYARLGDDIARAGGATLVDAQAAVTGPGFTRVDDIADDPHGHDPAVYWIYRHADVVFPGSDRAWFVTFSRSGGELVSVYDFE